jgi:hypothetical protein
MLPTIDVIKSIDISGIPTATCNTSDGCIAVGDADGLVSIFNIEGELTDSYSVEGKVTDLVFIQKNLIVGSSISGISIFSDSSEFHIPNPGCEIIVVSGMNFLVSDGSDSLYCFNSSGKLQWEKKMGHITHISSSTDGYSAIALENGSIVILDQSGGVLHESFASEDDIETVSCMVFRQDNILVVARNSLGLIIDNRPENRIECWSMERGLIHTCEVESLVNSICSNVEGVLLGCFNGKLLSLKIDSIFQELLAEFGYPVTNIFPWGDDVLIASWFDVARVNSGEGITWSLEHKGIVEHIVSIGEAKVAVLGDDKKSGKSNPIYIIDPNSETKSADFLFEEEFTNSLNSSDEFSGALSKDEEEASSRRPGLPKNTSEIFDALDEELQIIIDDPVVEIDLLEDLSKSAKSLNLPPIVDVGEDKTIASESDGTAIVLLDGSKSYDPDGFIKSWSWGNENEKVISESSQVKVKLPKGVHIFYLTVFDDKGASSRATLTIQVT